MLLSMLRAISKMLEDPASKEKVSCAKTILDEVIESQDPVKNMERIDAKNLVLLKEGSMHVLKDGDLDPAAESAKEELTG